MTTTQHGSPLSPAGRRRLAAIAVASAAALLLAGCAPQSPEAAERYAAGLAESPAVQEILVSTSTPFPFTVEARISIVLEPDIDRAGFDALRELSCRSVPNLSEISIEVDYELDGGTVARQSGLGDCWDDPASMIEALPALKAHAAQLDEVEWVEADYVNAGERHIVRTIDVELSDAGTAGGFDAVVGIVDDLIAEIDDDRDLAISAGGLKIEDGSSDSEARMVVEAAGDLAAEFPVVAITWDTGLFVQLEAGGDTAGVWSALGADYPELTVGSVVDSPEEVAYDQTTRGLLLAETLIDDTGLAKTLTVRGDRIDVVTESTATNVGIARRLESEGLGAVAVEYTTLEGGVARASARPGPEAGLTGDELLALNAVVVAVSATGVDATTTYDPEHLAVDIRGGGAAAEKLVRTAVASAVDQFGSRPSSVTVNGREVE